MQVEPGLIFMGAAAELDDVAVGQNNFEAEDIIARDPIFQAARAARIGGNVAAEGIIDAARGVGRIEKFLPLDGRLKPPRCSPLAGRWRQNPWR